MIYYVMIHIFYTTAFHPIKAQKKNSQSHRKYVGTCTLVHSMFPHKRLIQSSFTLH